MLLWTLIVRFPSCFSIFNLYDLYYHTRVQIHNRNRYPDYGAHKGFFFMNAQAAIAFCLPFLSIADIYGCYKDQGCLGSTLAVMKKSSIFLSVIGWSMWFSEYLFLERSWAKDESTLKSGLQRLKDYPQPFWLAIFVEGTRFTQAKLLAAQEFASSMGLPVTRNVLIPRTKGFVTSVSEMRSFAPVIYDMTVAIPKDSTPPTMLKI